MMRKRAEGVLRGSIGFARIPLGAHVGYCGVAQACGHFGASVVKYLQHYTDRVCIGLLGLERHKDQVCLSYANEFRSCLSLGGLSEIATPS